MNIKTIFKVEEGPSGYSCVFEDDGRVGYAYLCKDKKILSDVWLYNRSDTPDYPEWNNQKNAPFLNSREFTDQKNLVMPDSENEISFKWETHDATPGCIVWILGSEEILGKIEEGVKPGWSKHAIKPGPLAKALKS